MTSGRSLRLAESALALAVLGLGLFIATQTAMLQVGPAHAAVGPRLFPFLVATGLIVIGLLLLREAVFGHIAHERGIELDWRAVALISAALVAEMLLLELAGWIVAATVLFVIVAAAFGSRRFLVDALLGLVLTAGIFLVFNYGLDLSLPAGSLAERYLLPAEDP